MTAAEAAPATPPADGSPVPAWAAQLLVDVAVIRANLAPLVVRVDDHEARLRSLERRAYTLAGVATLAGAGVGQLLDLLKMT